MEEIEGRLIHHFICGKSVFILSPRNKEAVFHPCLAQRVKKAKHIL